MNKKLDTYFKAINKHIDGIDVPTNLNKTIYDSIAFKSNKEEGKRRKLIFKLSPLFMMLIVFFTLTYDAFAFYGQKFIGYEHLFEQEWNGNINDLMHTGKGQKIDKNVTFENGSTFTLDGIVYTEHDLFVLFKLNINADIAGDNAALTNLELRGIKQYIMSSGEYTLEQDTSIYYGVMQFEPPAFYERWMTLTVIHEGEQEKINFTLNRSEAYVSVVEDEISRVITGDNYVMAVDITVASNEIIIENNVKIDSTDYYNLFCNGLDDVNLTSGFNLLINDVKYRPQAFSTKLDGINCKVGNDTMMTYHISTHYYNIPDDIEQLELTDLYYGIKENIDFKTVIEVEPMVNHAIEDGLIMDVIETDQLMTINLTSINQVIFDLYVNNEEEPGLGQHISYIPYTVIQEERDDGRFHYKITYNVRHNQEEEIYLQLKDKGWFTWINEELNIDLNTVN